MQQSPYLENRIQKANIEKLKIKILTTIQAMIGSHRTSFYDCNQITDLIASTVD